MNVNKLFKYNLIDKKEKDSYLFMWLSKRYGVGYWTALNICSFLGFSSSVFKGELSEVELYEIQQYMESNIKLDSFLKKELFLKVDTLIKLKTYRGLRHKEGLPVRGQSSRSNARTQRKLKSIRLNMK